VVYKVTFIVLFFYFTYTSYMDGVSNSFISLDKTSGVCKGERGSDTCCEVPQTITGTFLADSRGRWNTQNGFSYINNNYAITVAGLEYTNEQWTEVMKNITAQLSTIGLKSENRDYAWYTHLVSFYVQQC
jgi:cellobiose phosphorylase